jgi:hypothetical protein
MKKLRIPSAARPVVEIIRREVRRPRRLPKPFAGKGCLRWWPGGFCPLGMIPRAINPTPVGAWGFKDPVLGVPVLGDEAIGAFWMWWDAQTDARAAVEAVWPRKKAKARKRGKGKA